MNNKIFVSNTLITLTALYILVNPIKAKAATPLIPLWQQVAQKLGIGIDQIQTAFQQIQSDRLKENLQKLVADGKLTQSQANTLLAKEKDWQNRIATIQKERKDWFQSQNLNLQDFRPMAIRRMSSTRSGHRW